MSADAKLWTDDPQGWTWKGIHDGPCSLTEPHEGLLDEVITEIRECNKGVSFRWEPFQYADGFGLRGYQS